MSIVSTVNLYVLPFSKRILEFPAWRSCICSVMPLSPNSWINTFPSVPSPRTSPILRQSWYATTATKHNKTLWFGYFSARKTPQFLQILFGRCGRSNTSSPLLSQSNANSKLIMTGPRACSRAWLSLPVIREKGAI